VRLYATRKARPPATSQPPTTGLPVAVVAGMKRRLDNNTATAHAASDARVCLAAVETLGKLHPEARVLHTGAIVDALADADQSVRRAAIRILTDCYIEQAALTLHAGAIVSR
jgi:hypothetical protein